MRTISTILAAAVLTLVTTKGELIQQLQEAQQAALDARSNPRAGEIAGELDAADAALAAAVAAAQALPDEVPDPDWMSTVTPEAIITGAGDILPRQPIDFTTDQDGEWHDAATWGGIVPPPNANCQVNHAVTFGVQDVVPYTYVEVTEGASLSFGPGAEMRFQTLAFHPGSTLNIGSAAARIPSANPVKLTFRDVPLPSGDEHEMSNGLICFDARVRMFGEVKTAWVRVDGPVSPDDTLGELGLQPQPTGWAAGDEVIVTATRQVGSGTPGTRAYTQTGGHELLTWPDGVAQIEHPTVGSVTPAIGNLTRAITVGSENPEGVRGHVMFAGRSSVWLEGVRFERSGRTRIGDIFSGDNQAGRYGAPHLHHCIGPVLSDIQQDGRAWQNLIRGCVGFFDPETNPTRWGFTVHGCSFNWLDANVVVGAGGSSINTENGQEWGCRFSNNLCCASLTFRNLERGGVVNVTGQGIDTGGDGSGIWLRSPGHEVYGNYVSGCFQSAYSFDGYYAFATVATLPAQPGDRNDTWTLAPGTNGDQPAPDFHDNVAVSCGVGYWATWSQAPFAGATVTNFRRHLVRDCVAANCATGYEWWHEGCWDFLRCQAIVTDPDVFLGEIFNPEEPRRSSYGWAFLAGTYENSAHRLIDCEVSGACVGVLFPKDMRGPAFSQHAATVPLPPNMDPTLFYEPVPQLDLQLHDCVVSAYYPLFARPVGGGVSAGRRVIAAGCTLTHQAEAAHGKMNTQGHWLDEARRVFVKSHETGGYVEINGETLLEP